MELEHTNRKKIALVAPSMQQIGGQSIQANRLLEAFEDDKNIELIFVPNNSETVFQNVKFLRTIFTSLKFWKQLLVSLPKVETVQISSAAVSGYVIATLPPLFIAKLFRKKTILNYHSGELEEHIRNWKLTAKPTMKLFDKIIVPSQFLVDIFSKFDLKAQVISNFIDTEKFVYRERNLLRPVFLSNRNFDTHYNVGDAFRAFRIIQNRFSEARLIVAGYGHEEAELKKLAEGLQLKNVEFIGKIPNEEMPQIYDRADIYLNTSLVDNMPLSFIEAFACGLPVVSYKTGGIPYIVENERTGILVEQKDFEALAEGAIRLLENNNLAQKITKNAVEEVEKYESAKVKENWREFYLKGF
jgi:L-malate glycosyltransferase